MPARPHRIVLDTDMGTDVDDALCLALALASPEIELVAVTHVSGDTRLRARITRRLLALAGRSDVPVHPGCARTRTGTASFVWLGHEGEGIVEPGGEAPIAEEPAAEALSRLFRTDPDLELVAVGPMTNLAAALDLDRGLAGRVKRLTVMGGHLRRVVYGGRELPHGVDYNLCADPEASRIVLSSGMPIRLVTADVTLGVWLNEDDARRLETSPSPLQRTLARAIRVWTPVQSRIFSALGARTDADNVAFLHDPLALASVYDESFCTFEDLAVEPLVLDGVFRTLERPSPAPSARPMRCATAVDARRFHDHFIERVSAVARNGSEGR